MKFNTILLLIVLTIVRIGNSQSTDTNQLKKKDWSLKITPYGLLAFNSTDVGGTRIRQSFNDLASITDAGFQLAASARYKKFHLFFDGTWATLGDQSNESVLNINLKVVQNILGFKLGYMIYENFSYEQDEILKGWSLTPSIGTKYWKNQVKLNYVLKFEGEELASGTINETLDWWDLMIGIKADFIITNKFMLNVAFDYGGFGINDSSKYAYDFAYINTFKISELLSINAGFRNFKYKRIDNNETGNLETTVNVFGPVIGASFKLY
ncbi:hypothetical protein [Cognatitamlana onchidii]|uniref:hypothetical protein n=1 Tax=Cognatitamlana onchidii TaxID=2562860 RepID=UPI0010A69F5F|nr:hypothetical protein [Algibacter onchidii]